MADLEKNQKRLTSKNLNRTIVGNPVYDKEVVNTINALAEKMEKFTDMTEKILSRIESIEKALTGNAGKTLND